LSLTTLQLHKTATGTKLENVRLSCTGILEITQESVSVTIESGISVDSETEVIDKIQGQARKIEKYNHEIQEIFKKEGPPTQNDVQQLIIKCTNDPDIQKVFRDILAMEFEFKNKKTQLSKSSEDCRRMRVPVRCKALFIQMSRHPFRHGGPV
jgi:hypothetical protein